MNISTDQTACNPESGAVSKIKDWSIRSTGWALVALGFSIPLSTSGTSISLAVILILWIIGGNYRSKFQIIRHNPLALASLLLFGLYVLGLFYGKPSGRVAFDVTHFLLLALFIPLFGDSRLRQHALWGFLSAVLIMLALSYLTWLHLLPRIAFLNIEPGNPLVIQDRITYGLFMALGVFFWVIEACFSKSRSKRVVLLILAVLAVFNLLGMIHNKTAYLVLPVLLGYFLIRQWRWKGATVCLLAVVLLVAAVWSLPASALHQRIAGAVKEFQQWQPDQAEATSTGLRLEFYRYSLRIIRDHPLFGAGIGGFAEAYAKQVKDPKMVLSDNPHNEYLMVTTQLGLIGLAALLYLFYTQWRLGAQLPTPRETILARGVVLAFVVGCLFNSFLTDYDEGVFFIWISALLFSGMNPLKKP
jgi:O-antigen ligase